MKNYNDMCKNCSRFGAECQGTTNQVYSGCVYKTVWKPLTKSEYIIWRAETREQLENEFPTYDAERITNYLDTIESLVRRRVERAGNKFTEFE